MLPNVLPQFSGGTKAFCSQSLCILDNITVDIINSQTGDINFNTLCGNCKGGNCRCVFSNINIFQSGSSVGNINFEQNCGSCSTPDPNSPGNFLKMDCKTGIPVNGPPSEKGFLENILNWISNNKIKAGIIVLVVFIIVGFSLWYLLKSDTKPDKPLSEKITLSDLLGDYGYMNNM